MQPIPVTETITRLPLVPPDRVNAYLVGGVLIDSGGRLAGPGHPVAGTLSEGDEIGGLKVIEVPGHTPGHLAFWEERTRTLIIGDVLFHTKPVTLRKGLSEPFRFATVDRAENLRSARKLAALDPDTICFGHGPPLTDTDAFQEFVAGLPQP